MTTTNDTKQVNIYKLLADRLENERADLAAHNELFNALKLVDGKPINKRILSKLPQGSELDTRYGMFHIKLNGRSHLIGYNSNPFVDAKQFDERFDTCYGMPGAGGRISQLEGFLNSTRKLEALENTFNKVAETFSAFKQAVKELEASKFESYYNPAYYELLRTMGVPSTLVSDIRFDKFDEK